MKAIFSDSYGIDGVDFGPSTNGKVPWVRQNGEQFESGIVSHGFLVEALEDHGDAYLQPSLTSPSREAAEQEILSKVNEEFFPEPLLVEAVDKQWSNDAGPYADPTTAVRRGVFMDEGFYHSGLMVATDMSSYNMTREAFATKDEARRAAERLDLTSGSDETAIPTEGALTFDAEPDANIQAEFEASGGFISTYASNKNLDILTAAQSLRMAGAIEASDVRLSAIGAASLKQSKDLSNALTELQSETPIIAQGWESSQERIRVKVLQSAFEKKDISHQKIAEHLEDWALTEAKTGSPDYAISMMRTSAVAQMSAPTRTKNRKVEAVR